MFGSWKSMTEHNSRRWIPLPEYARRKGMSLRQAQRLIQRGELEDTPAVRENGRIFVSVSQEEFPTGHESVIREEISPSDLFNDQKLNRLNRIERKIDEVLRLLRDTTR